MTTKDEPLVTEATINGDGITYVPQPEPSLLDRAYNQIVINTIASLDQVDALNDDCLFEVSAVRQMNAQGNGTLVPVYESRAVEFKVLLSKVQSATLEYVNQSYINLRYLTLKDTAIKGALDDNKKEVKTEYTVHKYLANIQWDASLVNQWNEETTTPIFWHDIHRLAIEAVYHKYLLDELDKAIKNEVRSKIAFAPDSKFVSSLSTFEELTGVPRTIRDAPESLSAAYSDSTRGIHEGFLMAFYNRNTVSNIYRCPEQGVLSLYGWLDSSAVQDLDYLPTCWCALEGFIKGSWEILQLAQVLPNRLLTYVSFAVPVKKDLEVRLRLGFNPGNGSSRYSHEDIVNSLSNHVPNAFLGGVYSSPEASQTQEATSGSVAPRSAEVGQPVGTVITNIYRPEGEGILTLNGDESWVYCNGVTVKSADYPELFKLIAGEKSKKKTFSIPDFSQEKLPHYIKVK